MFRGKRVAVTGVCGTIGRKLIEKMLDRQEEQPEEIFGIDNDESGLFFLDQQYTNAKNVNFSIVDVRDRESLIRAFDGIDIVFHAAALKHVILNERSPEQSVKTNIVGVQNVIEAARRCNVEHCVFTSSDKAVNPTNVMGTSKLMGERLITAANSNREKNGTIFSSTRFGNVLGSNGSVVQVFRNQIVNGGPVTLTDEKMTRFVMSADEAVELVLDTVSYARGGEIFITKMPVLRIVDLAKAMVEQLSPVYGYAPEEIEIIHIGTKPGEKLYEELMSHEETRRAIELDRYFCVLPAFRGIYNDIEYEYPNTVTNEVNNPYNSNDEQGLSVGEITELLKSYGLLDRIAN